MPDRPPPWRRARPAGPRTALTPELRAAAQERARRAGRPYPNLVDNLAVLRAARVGAPLVPDAARAPRRPRAKPTRR